MKETPEEKRKRYIKLMTDFYEREKRVPKKREFTAYTTVFIKTFGSWNNAIKAAGLEVRREIAPSKAKLKKSLIDFYIKHRVAPRANDCRKENGLYDTKTYYRLLGVNGWGNVLKSVNVDPYFHVSKTVKNKENSRKLIINFVKKHNLLHSNDYRVKNKNLPSVQYIQDHLGGWNSILIDAGLKFALSESIIKESVLTFYREKGFAPTLLEISTELKTNRRSITVIIGSYIAFLKGLNINPRFAPSPKTRFSNKQLRELYIDYSKKYGYKNGLSSRAIDQLKELPKTDVFVLRFGSIGELKRLSGFKSADRTKHTQKQLTDILLSEYRIYGRILTNREINDDKELPSVSTFTRIMKNTSMKKIWKIVLKNSL